MYTPAVLQRWNLLFTDLIWSRSGTEDTLYCLTYSESAVIWWYCTMHYAMTYGSKSCRWTNSSRLLKAPETSCSLSCGSFRKSERWVLATYREEIAIDEKRLLCLFVWLRWSVSLRRRMFDDSSGKCELGAPLSLHSRHLHLRMGWPSTTLTWYRDVGRKCIPITCRTIPRHV